MFHSDRHLKKMKPKSPPSRSSSDTSDWRMVGKSSRDRVSSSLKKKVEQPTSTARLTVGSGSMSMTGSGSSETSQMAMTSTDQRNPNSISTRREMRGLMKAIDSASNSDNRERKDARSTPEKSESSTLKYSPKKTLSNQKLESPSQSSSAPSLLSNKRSDVPEPLNRNRGVNPTATTEDNNGFTEHPQIQSRQASAENSFIQRVRRFSIFLDLVLTLCRSLSFRQSQPKQNPKQL